MPLLPDNLTPRMIAPLICNILPSYLISLDVFNSPIFGNSPSQCLNNSKPYTVTKTLHNTTHKLHCTIVHLRFVLHKHQVPSRTPGNRSRNRPLCHLVWSWLFYADSSFSVSAPQISWPHNLSHFLSGYRLIRHRSMTFGPTCPSWPRWLSMLAPFTHILSFL